MGKYYKHPQYGSVFSNDAYMTPPCRLCFPALVKPKDPPAPRPGDAPGQPRYEATLLFPKESKAHTEFLRAMELVTQDMLKVFNMGRSAKIGELAVVKDGDAPYWQAGENADKYPYYKGQFLLAARNTVKPSIVGPDTKPIDPAKLIGGTEVVAIIIPIIVATGVTYKLKVIQLIKDDGVRFAGGARSDDDYIKMLTSVVPASSEAQETEEVGGEETGSEESIPTAVLVDPPQRVVKTFKKSGKTSIANLV